MSFLSGLLLLALPSFVAAAPVIFPSIAPRAPFTSPYHVLYTRQGAVVRLSDAEVNAFIPSVHLTSVPYCSREAIQAWNCGEHCNAIPNFEVSLVGGDGAATPNFYVGFDPDSQQIVIGHQGTDPTKLRSLLVDADFPLDPLDPAIFPGVPGNLKAHGGFQDSHARSSAPILQAVRAEIQNRGVSDILLVGHSLGGALALLDAVFLDIALAGTGATIRTITYGMPRVGNQEFANFVDREVQLQRVTSREDIVPILPGRFLGYRHPQGEAHIDEESGVMVACPGQENDDERCIVGDARNIFDASIPDHFGPYAGVTIGC